MRRHVGKSKKAFTGFYAVEPRHLPIDEGDFVWLTGFGGLTNHFNSLLAGGCFIGHQIHVAEQVRYYGAGWRIVVDNEDAPSVQVRAQHAWPPRQGCFSEAGSEAEHASFAVFAHHADLSAHELGQPLGNGKSEPRAAIFACGGGVSLFERTE